MADSQAKIVIGVDDQATGPLQQVNASFKNLQGTLVDIRPYMSGAMDGVGEFGGASKAAVGSIADLTASLKQATAAMQAAEPGSAAFVNSAEDIAAIQKDINLAQKDAKIAGDAFLGINQRNTQQLNAFKDALREVAPQLGRFGDLGAIAEGAGIAALVLGLAEVAKQAVADASAFQLISNQAQAVFGNDFPQMSAAADQLSASFGRSHQETLGMVTTLTTAAQAIGVSKTAAEQMSEGLGKLAIQMALVKGTSDADAVNALTMAMEGNYRGLKQYQVVLSDATLQEYAHSVGIKAKVTDMDTEQKSILAYNYLMNQTSNIQKAAKKDQGDMDDETKKMGASWNNLMETFGKPALPIVTAAIDTLSGALQMGGQLVGAFGSAMADDFGYAMNLAHAIENLLGIKTPDVGMPDGRIAFSASDFADAIDSTHTSFNNFGVDMNDTSKGSAAAAKALEALKQEMETLGQTYDTTSTNLADKLTELDQAHKDKVTSMTDKINTLKDSLNSLAESFQNNMDSINQSETDALIKGQDNIDKLKDQLAAKELEVARKKQGGGSVDVKLQDEVNDLQKKLAKAQSDQATGMDMVGGSVPGTDVRSLEDINGSIKTVQANLTRLQEQKDRITNGGSVPVALSSQIDAYAKQLADLQATLQTVTGKSTSVVADQFNQEKDLGPTSLSILKDEDKRANDTAKNDAQKKKILDQINAETLKVQQENAAYGEQRTSIVNAQNAMIAFHDQYVQALQNMADVTKQQLKSMKDDLADIANTMTSALANAQGQIRVGQGGGTRATTSGSTTIPGRAGGGYVNENITLVGERGPELVSLPNGSYVHPSGQGPDTSGGSISFSIGEIHVHNEADEDRLVKKMLDAVGPALARKMQLKTLSSS